MVPSDAPLIVNRSMKTAAADVESAVAPSPTRTTEIVGVQTPDWQETPSPSLHDVPSAWGGLLGIPAVQRSAVQTFPSTGTSVLSGCWVMPPAPSQTFVSQSPTVCVASTVPALTLIEPQSPALQTAWVHGLPVAGQSAFAAQCPSVTR